MWKPSVTPGQVIMHSQGPWIDHKYVKKEGEKYFYPDSYEGGRHVNGEGSSSSGVKRYSDGDGDFDDKNYSPKNLLGDTDFYGFTTKDGRTVILQEDAKWELPAGKKIDKKLVSRLEAFDKEIERRRNAGEKISSDEWEKLASEAVSGSGAKKTSSKKGSSASKGSKGKSSKSKEMSDRERRAKNKQTMKARTEEQQKNKERRMKKNSLKGKEYLNHSFWAPTEDYLMHHGVDGQKWGVRNGPPYPLEKGHKTSGKRKYRTDNGYKKRKEDTGLNLSNKPLNEMTNKEIKQHINRMKLEQQYKDLKKSDIDRGRERVMSYVRDYATLAGAVATTASIARTVYSIKTGKKI